MADDTRWFEPVKNDKRTLSGVFAVLYTLVAAAFGGWYLYTSGFGLVSTESNRGLYLLFTSVLFGMEHVTTAPSTGIMVRRFIFTVALGLLLGIIVLISSNLHLAAGMHAWINWLLLAAVPRFVDDTGQSLLLPGTYIGISMALAFVLLFVVTGRRRR